MVIIHFSLWNQMSWTCLPSLCSFYHFLFVMSVSLVPACVFMVALPTASGAFWHRWHSSTPTLWSRWGSWGTWHQQLPSGHGISTTWSLLFCVSPWKQLLPFRLRKKKGGHRAKSNQGVGEGLQAAEQGASFVYSVFRM